MGDDATRGTRAATRRAKTVVACAAAIATVFGLGAAGVAFVRGGSDAASAPIAEPAAPAPHPPITDPWVDGLITTVDGRRLVLRIGPRTSTFRIEPNVAETLDLRHLRIHARDEMPTRVWYRGSGRTLAVVAMTDAPINS